MTRALPAVSVIVPTRNVPPILGRTLANLANQTLPPHSYEVIVVTGEDVADAWQLFDNGRAFGAYLLTCAANHTVPGGQVASFALRNWLYWAQLRRLLHRGAMPRSLLLAELQCALISP